MAGLRRASRFAWRFLTARRVQVSCAGSGRRIRCRSPSRLASHTRQVMPAAASAPASRARPGGGSQGLETGGCMSSTDMPLHRCCHALEAFPQNASRAGNIDALKTAPLVAENIAFIKGHAGLLLHEGFQPAPVKPERPAVEPHKIGCLGLYDLHLRQHARL